MKTLLIDGNSLINRAFYALPVLTTAEGIYTNAVYGFLKMFYKAADGYAPDNIVCAFDLKQPTFRHERFPEYKAGRKKMPEELVPQIPLLKEILTSLGVKCVSVPGFEADDIIGTYARLTEEAGGEAAVITGDRDSFQLISEKTSVWFTKKGISDILVLTPENIKENYGVTADKVCDLKGLMGDSSDNIPGVAGIGEKTALALIEKYGSIENLYADAEAIPGKQGEKIRAGRESAFESKSLATIVRDVPVEPLETCAYLPCDDKTAYEIFKKYELRSLYDRVGGANEKFEPITEEFRGFEENIKMLAVYADDERVLISTDGKKEYVIPLGFDLLSQGMLFDDVKKLLEPLLLDENTEKYFYDCKSALHEWGEINNIKGDIMLAEYLLEAGNDDFSFEKLEERYSVTRGAAAILYIHGLQEKALEKRGLMKLYRETELPLARVLYKMEMTGFFVDEAVLRELGKEFSQKLNTLTENIYMLAGREFNINSPAQLAEVLFEDLRIPAKKKTKRGYSTDNDVLEAIEHPIAEMIIEYRQIQKLKSTYVDAMFGLISQDGRIHTTFKQAVAATGRISSTEPNLQNIPVRSEEGRRIRKAFLAEKEGYVLVNADYSQIELRILAHLSGDKEMIKTFISGGDIHASTAAAVMNKDISDVTDTERSKAKAVNFGIVYGISDFGLAKNINSTQREAAEFMEKYFEKYPEIKEYMARCVSEAKRTGCTRTLFGRVRALPQIKSQNYNIRSFGERVAMNAPIQGTAADIIKLAMLRVQEKLEENGNLGKMILQVHDELIIEVKREYAEETEKMLRDVMENVYALSVPLKTETNMGRTWFELK